MKPGRHLIAVNANKDTEPNGIACNEQSVIYVPDNDTSVWTADEGKIPCEGQHKDKSIPKKSCKGEENVDC